MPQQCPADISELIKDCMKLEPDERPSARDIFDRLKVTTLPPLWLYGVPVRCQLRQGDVLPHHNRGDACLTKNRGCI